MVTMLTLCISNQLYLGELEEKNEAYFDTGGSTRTTPQPLRERWLFHTCTISLGRLPHHLQILWCDLQRLPHIPVTCLIVKSTILHAPLPRLKNPHVACLIVTSTILNALLPRLKNPALLRMLDDAFFHANPDPGHLLHELFGFNSFHVLHALLHLHLRVVHELLDDLHLRHGHQFLHRLDLDLRYVLNDLFSNDFGYMNHLLFESN